MILPDVKYSAHLAEGQHTRDLRCIRREREDHFSEVSAKRDGGLCRPSGSIIIVALTLMAVPPHILSTYSSIAHAISSPSSTNHAEFPRSHPHQPSANPFYLTNASDNIVSNASSPNALLQGQIDGLYRVVKELGARVQTCERKHQGIDRDIRTLMQCFFKVIDGTRHLWAHGRANYSNSKATICRYFIAHQ